MLPETRHRPVNDGKSTACPGVAAGVAVTSDGPVGTSAPPAHATVSTIAGM